MRYNYLRTCITLYKNTCMYGRSVILIDRYLNYDGSKKENSKESCKKSCKEKSCKESCKESCKKSS